MKRSTQISLVVLATLSMTACSRSDSRMQYRSYQDCVLDWGDATLCQPSGSTYLGPVFYTSAGVYYYYTANRTRVKVPSNGALSRQSTSRTSIGKTTVRGGFGSSGSSSS
ncbi:hypothetical protein [Deinococcus roseus]|uniref:Lipoprotein n=1 Tax=Deinococcus roseus TaxID=392414 RepID=A0ABQ2DAQ5_9DEIO|nr:hypothetical protein [Deinococcus roseus]GGJ49411.1 hypothetical protein GCM10008938_39220 [Deinococcus roseus]